MSECRGSERTTFPPILRPLPSLWTGSRPSLVSLLLSYPTALPAPRHFCRAAEPPQISKRRKLVSGFSGPGDFSSCYFSPLLVLTVWLLQADVYNPKQVSITCAGSSLELPDSCRHRTFALGLAAVAQIPSSCRTSFHHLIFYVSSSSILYGYFCPRLWD